jgi:hypothetical protein
LGWFPPYFQLQNTSKHIILCRALAHQQPLSALQLLFGLQKIAAVGPQQRLEKVPDSWTRWTQFTGISPIIIQVFFPPSDVNVGL